VLQVELMAAVVLGLGKTVKQLAQVLLALSL
jgi:hypothetical protein